jgi:arylsulfatase
MHAEFPIHQQGQLAIMSPEAVEADVIRGSDPSTQLQTYTLDKTFVTNPSHMVTGVEVRDGKLYEIDLEAGEVFTQSQYCEMNERYQRNVVGQPQELAAQDKTFFLNYWPLFPLTFIPFDIAEAETLNGGTVAQSIVEVDRWIGEIIAEVDRLGIAENTIVMVMGDTWLIKSCTQTGRCHARHRTQELKISGPRRKRCCGSSPWGGQVKSSS